MAPQRAKTRRAAPAWCKLLLGSAGLLWLLSATPAWGAEPRSGRDAGEGVRVVAEVAAAALAAEPGDSTRFDRPRLYAALAAQGNNPTPVPEEPERAPSVKRGLLIGSLVGLAAGAALSATGLAVAQGGRTAAEAAGTADDLASGNKQVRTGNRLQYAGWAVGIVAFNVLLISQAVKDKPARRRTSRTWDLRIGPGHAALLVRLP